MTEAERDAHDANNGMRRDYVEMLSEHLEGLDLLAADIRAFVENPPTEALEEDVDAGRNIILPEIAGVRATLETARNVIAKGIK